MHRLSGMDTAFLYAETRAMHLHAGALMILDHSAAPGAFDAGAYGAVLAARLERLDVFRQRLVTVPFGIDRPVWVDDGDFDPAAHVHPIAVPQPGDPHQVAELVGRLLAIPLPRDRPLWEVWFIEGLEHGHVGVLWKVHHALLGGVRAIAMFDLVFDLDADLEPGSAGDGGEPDRATVERAPSPLAAGVHAAGSLASTPLRAARATGDVARAAGRVARFLTTSDRGGVVLPFVAPATPLNGSLVPGRTFAYTSVSLAHVMAVKAAVGVTVNDVVLALCGGALRNHLEERGELPTRSLTASVPVSVAGPDDAVGSLGNMQSVFGATLATNVADPVERLRRIHASTRAAKSVHRALGRSTLLHLADVLPPGLFGALIHGWAATGMAARMVPPFNLVVSNLVGPSSTLYSAGARVVSCHVLGPVIEGVSLNITVLSYRDAIDIGIVASPNLVADAWPIADRIAPALAELEGAAVPA